VLLQKSSCFQFAFKTPYISQGSVATHFRCGGIFSDIIITHFLLIVTVKLFLNRLTFDKVKAYKEITKFSGPPVRQPLFAGTFGIFTILLFLTTLEKMAWPTVS